MITKKGIVVKKSGDKTVRVQVVSYKSHPKYHKRYRVDRFYLVHDEQNEASVGQAVGIRPVAPVSKRKSWSLLKAA